MCLYTLRLHIGRFGPSDNVSDLYCLSSDMKAVLQCLKVKMNSENGHPREMINLILVEIDLIKNIYLHLQLVKHFTHKWRKAGKKHLASKSVLVETSRAHNQITGRK